MSHGTKGTFLNVFKYQEEMDFILLALRNAWPSFFQTSYSHNEFCVHNLDPRHGDFPLNLGPSILKFHKNAYFYRRHVWGGVCIEAKGGG